jgi:hypothetical protein
LSSAASVSVDGKKLFASVNEDRDFVFCSSTLSVSETARDAVRTATGNEKIEVSAVMSHVFFCFFKYFFFLSSKVFLEDEEGSQKCWSSSLSPREASSLIKSQAFSRVRPVPLVKAGHVLMEDQDQGHGHGWRASTHSSVGAREDLMHELVFAIKQRNIDTLKERIAKTSDLHSPLYGQHLSFEEVGELCANREGTAAVKAWLEASGVTSIVPTKHGEYIRASAPISTWNSLLKTRFLTFVRREHGGALAGKATGIATRALRYYLPDAMAEHVPYVLKATDLPTERRHGARGPATPLSVGGLQQAVAAADSAGAQVPTFPNSVTPQLLETFYNITNHVVVNGSMGVFESLGESLNTRDLARFQNTFALPLLTYDNVVGGHVGPHIIDGFEAMLDVEVGVSLGACLPTQITFCHFFLST